MIQKMTRSIEEQNQGSRVIARANENMKKLTQEVADATSHQSKGFQNVIQKITQVSEMVDSLFREAEKRKLESESIIEGIDALEKKRSLA
jgi:methyl-accepting chemotaxis protein